MKNFFILFAVLALTSGCINRTPPVINTLPTTTVTLPNTDFGTDCSVIESQVNRLMEQANYCSMDLDCILPSIDPGCPFGCFMLANKNVDLGEIAEGLEIYHKRCPTCVYKCMAPPNYAEVKCIAGKCADARLKQ